MPELEEPDRQVTGAAQLRDSDAQFERVRDDENLVAVLNDRIGEMANPGVEVGAHQPVHAVDAAGVQRHRIIPQAASAGWQHDVRVHVSDEAGLGQFGESHVDPAAFVEGLVVVVKCVRRDALDEVMIAELAGRRVGRIGDDDDPVEVMLVDGKRVGQNIRKVHANTDCLNEHLSLRGLSILIIVRRRNRHSASAARFAKSRRSAFPYEASAARSPLFNSGVWWGASVRVIPRAISTTLNRSSMLSKVSGLRRKNIPGI